MADIIFLIAFIVEGAFVIYCFCTKSYQVKTRSYIRFGALAAFILFTLVSIIQWSFRWYGFAALLFVCAGFSVWTLLGKKTGQDDYKPKKIVRMAIGMLLLTWLALVPAFIFPQYKSPRVTGKHAVNTAGYTYTDPNRVETFTHSGANREVNIQCWYPREDGEKYPLVVFSHGAFGVKISNTSTYTELASHGYVVCAIDHPYHALFTIDSNHNVSRIDPSFFQEVIDANNGKYDEAAVFKLEQKWLKLRTTDIIFVLDTLVAQAKDPGSNPVYQRIDPTKIGLMGHSLGGAASAQVARERSDIGAVVNLDADLLGEYLDYTDGKYVMNPDVYPAPLLTIFADDMVRLMDAVPDANKVIAVKRVTASTPDAFEVHISGTDHQSLTDLPLFSPFMVSMITNSVQKAGGGETADKVEVIEKMNDTVLAFFNVYLKGEGNFSAALTD